ncbi:MAG: hypothetical protein EOP38_22330, partial [Rubrivivax sp.]
MNRRHQWLRMGRLGTLPIALACLQACSGYQAFQKGQTALSEGRLEDGLYELRKAADAAPGNTDYRRTYFTRRDEIVMSLSRQGEQALDRGDVEAARRAYQQIVNIQSDAAAGHAGLNRVEGAQRHQTLLDAARAHVERSDLQGALTKTQQVLSENANHRTASTLQRKLQRQLADATGKELGIYPKLKAVYRTPVSLSFTSASLRQVFEALKLASNLNY